MILVLQTDDGLPVLFDNDDIEFLFRHIHIYRINSHLLASDGMLFEHAQLISIGGVSREIVVGSNTGEGVLLVAHGLF